MILPFCFGSTSIHTDAVRFAAIVPPGVISRDTLFDVLAEELAFPKWFGRNWDALSELLSSLDWIEQELAVIIHADVPLQSNNADAATYLAILRDAVLDRESDKEHRLEVWFPENARALVSGLMTGPGLSRRSTSVRRSNNG